jgi:hypothetical protein
MEAIKKKMQALKIEKDNALDRAESAENQLRDSNLRVEKVRFDALLNLTQPILTKLIRLSFC